MIPYLLRALQPLPEELILKQLEPNGLQPHAAKYYTGAFFPRTSEPVERRQRRGNIEGRLAFEHAMAATGPTRIPRKPRRGACI